MANEVDESSSTGNEPVEKDAATLAAELAETTKRLSGKDQALTRIQGEAQAEKARADRLAAKVAELEGTNLTELERAQKEAADARAEAQAARLEAQRTKLGAKYPKYAEFAEQTAGKSEEEVAEAFVAFLAANAPAAGTAPGTTQSPRVDPNQPRKGAGQPGVDPNSVEGLRAALDGMPFPGYE